MLKSLLNIKENSVLHRIFQKSLFKCCIYAALKCSMGFNFVKNFEKSQCENWYSGVQKFSMRQKKRQFTIFSGLKRKLYKQQVLQVGTNLAAQ